MSEDTTLVLKTPTALERPQFLKELSSNITAMNQLIADCSILTSNVSEYEKSLMYGHLLVKIKEQISGKALEIIKELMNTGLGFKTDHNPDAEDARYRKPVYNDEIIKNISYY